MSKYSQTRAMFAIMRGALRSILRSPSAVVFSLAFPLIFIIVFGFISGGKLNIDIGVEPGTDTTHFIYKAIAKIDGVNLNLDPDTAAMHSELAKGRIDATIFIQQKEHSLPATVALQTTAASREKGAFVKLILQSIVSQANLALVPKELQIAELKQTEVEGRAYRTIDFILPGQLGFSLLSAGVFGTAFVFYNLRQQLILKRFFATPIRKPYIIFGECLARIIFQMMGSLIIILLGHFAFGFTLIHGFITVLELLTLSMLGLLVFMGVGFVVSGIAKNESAIPPVANLFTMPQFLLAGTFFPISAFPSWLQPVSKALPLTYLNDAMRNVAFEGQNLWDVRMDLLILMAWGVVVYFLAVKTFKWE